MSRRMRIADCHPDRKHYAHGLCRRCYLAANRADPAAHVTAHGYGGYGNGCRCDICTGAKAAYIRERRTAATQAAGDGIPVAGVRHGTRFAYEERGCRCDACRAVQRLRSARENKRRQQRGQVAA